MTKPSPTSDVRGTEQCGAQSTAVVLLIGTLDTKSVEIAAVAGEIEALGGSVLLLDTSGRAHPTLSTAELAHGRALLSRDDVAKAAGSNGTEIAALPRGEAVAQLRAGVQQVSAELYEGGRIHGALCVGGAGAYIASDAFAALPVGFPKLIVSPLASGQRVFEPYMGTRDVATLHSVADIVGINPITEKVFKAAAGYIVGAARAARTTVPQRTRPTVAISMNGNTTDALMMVKSRLEERDWSIVAFHANGVGGRALEEFVGTGGAAAVLDYTTTELGGHQVGGLMDAGPNRMETAGSLGIPQVLVPGCLDFITCGRPEEAKKQFPGRPMFLHNPELTLVRLTTAEMRALGATFARKANAAIGTVTICVPTGGLSVSDAPGKVFWDPEADAAFVAGLQEHLASHIPLILTPHHINDPRFVEVVMQELLAVLPGAHTAPAQQQASSGAVPSYGPR